MTFSRANNDSGSPIGEWPIPDAVVLSAVATEEQEALRREVPASPQLSSAAVIPDLSLMMALEGKTVDFFDQMGVPLPAYARRQLRGYETRRLDFGQAS